MRKFALAIGLFVSVSSPAMAAQFVVGAGTDTSPLASNNDFKSQLSGLGLTILRTSAPLSITGPAKITYEYFASESGFRDTFTSGTVSYTETNKSAFGPVPMGTATFLNPADFFARFTSSGHAQTHNPGTVHFGYVLPTGTPSGIHKTSTLWIAYDDQINNADDNHDDFIIRATIAGVPEPATWAMMIGGFGLAGAALRRRPARNAVLA
jgi:hypothetical protein